MKSKLTYVGKIECHDCGTGYGKTGPLCEYENDGDPSGDAVILCEECAEKREESDKCPIEVDEDNYFDVAEALHAVLTVWHDGGRGYELLCRSEFKPGHSWSESVVEEENEYFSEIEALYEKGTNFDAMEKILDAIDEILEQHEED